MFHSKSSNVQMHFSILLTYKIWGSCRALIYLEGVLDYLQKIPCLASMFLDGFGVLLACRLRKRRKKWKSKGWNYKVCNIETFGGKKSWKYWNPKVSKLQGFEVRPWISTVSRANQYGLGSCVLSAQQNGMHYRERVAATAACLISISPEQKVLKDMKKHQHLMRHRILTKLYIDKIMRNWESKKIPKLFWGFRKVYFHSKSKLFLTILLNKTMKLLLGANLFHPSFCV